VSELFDRERLTGVPAPAREEPPEPEPSVPAIAEEAPVEAPAEHAEPRFRVPEGYTVVEGAPRGDRRAVAVVVSRFNGEITTAMLRAALDELGDAGVARDAITVVPVPGAFELPLAATALAKTRRFACVVAIGCVIRGETPHFDFVAGETASGLQLAGLETGVPVAFGVLTCETREQAQARTGRAADVARGALEMADVLSKIRVRSGATATG
jgi:6,7-dimethyl-8-ribityllumazine synthase